MTQERLDFVPPAASKSPTAEPERQSWLDNLRAHRRAWGAIRGLREIIVIGATYTLYDVTRYFVSGDHDVAVRHGKSIYKFEKRLGIAPEHALNKLFSSHLALGLPADYIYATLHYIVTPAVLIWLWRRYPAAYGSARTVLIATTVVGLIGFALLPVAPPRLLGGFVDTMAHYSRYGWWSTAGSAPRGLGSDTNQYAAMPSLHVGWAVWSGWQLLRHGRHRITKILGVLYPFVLSVVVIGTGNHYFLDVVAGFVVVGIGVGISRLITLFDWDGSARVVAELRTAGRAGLIAGFVSATYRGIGVSNGVAAGPVARVHGPVLPPRDGASIDVASETERAADALDEVGGELEALGQRAGASGAVLVRQARIARDPSLSSLASQLVSSGRAAPRAAWEAFGAYRDMRAADPMRAVPDRAELDDIRDRVVARLLGEPPPGIPDPGTPYVLVARDLSPAVTAGLDPQRVLAIVTERGGPTSHTAVLAKSLGIPAVVGCPGVASLRSGQRVMVDGGAGEVTADPDAETLGAVSRAEGAAAASASADRGPGRTRDGHQVQLMAAVSSGADAAEAIEAGAEGVGVFRTEFAFLDRSEPPSVAEQAAAYREVFDAFPNRQVTVRTLDIGADKPAPFVRLGDQPNPALGVRGLRVARRHPELLTDQLTAIANATRGTTAQVRVMAPMVATSAEAAWFAAQAHQAGVGTTGVMVEVPAAALRAADLLRVVDFVSVGSNDLAQYTFATDRADGELSDLLDPWQPAFLDLVATVLRAGAIAGRPVTVCGEAPSDPLLALVLVGLGAAALSMTPRALSDVRMALARHSIDDCVRFAAAAVSADGPSEARARVREALDRD